MRRLGSSWSLGLALSFGTSCGGTPDATLGQDRGNGAVEGTSRAASSDVGTPTVLLLLDGEGLRVVDAASGTTRAVPFGWSSGDVVEVVERARGTQPREQGESPCGGTFATWDGGPSLRFSEGRFVGWSTNDPGLTTAGGLGVGSTLEDVEAVYVLERIRSSLGWEFTTAGMAGVLDGEGSSSRVAALWAGEVCLGR